jgi:SAM-dependent methyltransferase
MTASNLCPPKTAIVEACPVCGATGERWKFSSRDFLHGIPGAYHYVTCLGCGSVRQNPRIVVEDLALCYPRAYYTHQAPHGDPAATLPRSGSLRDRVRRAVLHYADGAPGSPISAPMKCLGAVLALIPAIRSRARFGLIDLLATSGLAGARCLEVGPGQGLTLLRLRWIGWDAVGIDNDPAAAETARRTSGCAVKAGSICDADFADSSFELIYMHHVIEHVHNLVESLQRCHSLLAPGGRVVLVYPNPRSIGGRAHREYSPNWDPPRHLILPTCGSIEDLLRRVGFDRVESWTSAERAAALRCVARRYRRGRAGVGLGAGSPSIGDRLFGYFESSLVAVGFPVGEEIVVVAHKALEVAK